MGTSIILNENQSAVLDEILVWLGRGERYLVIGGYAGTGKTTLIGHMRQAITDRHPDIERVAFCCYTGKAAAVLRGKLQEADALLPQDSCGTIHSLIYKPITDEEGQISRWERVKSLATDLIVIDEGSMLNQGIWLDLLGYGKPILVFGDHGQLPPIEGSFNLLATPDLRLETIVRQAAESPIIRLSQAIREGKPIPYGQFYNTVHKLPAEDNEIWDTLERLAGEKSEDQIWVCARNKTRIGLNARIREIRGFEGEKPQKGEQLICLKNNYTKMIFNGMVGTVERMEPEGEHWYKARIDMGDGQGMFRGNICRYQFNRLTTLKPGAPEVPVGEKEWGDLFDFGYCLTVHKAQGSESRRVVVFDEPMFRYDEEMRRRWLYTAVTRAREEVYIVG